MRKVIKTMALTATLLFFSTVGVKADVNTNTTFYFTANGQKQTTSYSAKKPDDGDNRVYITTLATSNDGNVKSTVFPNGGTFYCRTRLAANDTITSPLFTFTSNQSQVKSYQSGNARYGASYVLRGEIDSARISSVLRQSVRWCP